MPSDLPATSTVHVTGLHSLPDLDRLQLGRLLVAQGAVVFGRSYEPILPSYQVRYCTSTTRMPVQERTDGSRAGEGTGAEDEAMQKVVPNNDAPDSIEL